MSNPHQYFHREKESKDAYQRKWLNTQQLQTSTLDRNSILHWSGDPETSLNTDNHPSSRSNHWQTQVSPNKNNNNLRKNSEDIGTLNRRNVNTLKKLGVSCQNLSSTTNTPERNFSAKSISKTLSKSEYDLSSRKISSDSTNSTGIKSSVSRFDIMTKFFNFNKNNKIEPIMSSLAKQSATNTELSKRVERVGWMKNISNYFAKKTRRSSDR